MKSNQKTTIVIYCVTAAILATPLLLMQFTSEVNWDFKDFIVMGILLFSTATAINFIISKKISTKNKILFVVGILLILMLIWAELAVGILGSPFAGN